MESPADTQNILNNYYDKKQAGLRAFVYDSKTQNLLLDDMKNTSNPPMVQTIGAQRDANMIRSYLETEEPFILVGPEGCGKSLVI